MPPFKLTPLSALRTSVHHIPAHGNIPNTSLSTHPLIIYHSVFPSLPAVTPAAIESHVAHIGVFAPKWRYTMYSISHFHSVTHELLVISTGAARLLLGGDGNPGGMEVEVQKGDALLMPAGVAHRLLEDLGAKDGAFEMVGSYPVGAPSWDMCYGDGRQEEDSEEIRKRISALGWFDRDPLYGDDGPALKV